METTPSDLELICKLRQRLVRLIKLGEPNEACTALPANDHSSPSGTSVDRTGQVEECVRRLFNGSCPVELFIQDVQRILTVTIKSNLGVFFLETIPLAQQYLRQQNCDPFSWETFKAIPIQTLPLITPTRLPSLQQARFRLPPACPQLIDLTSSLPTRSVQESTLITPHIRSDANIYQQKLIHRFAQHHFHLNECGEHLILRTLDALLKHILRRLLFFTNHRIDTHLLGSQAYEMTSNVREQIRFLVDASRIEHGDSFQSALGQPRAETMNKMAINDDQEKRTRTREYRLSVLEELRQKEADETACFVLRQTRLKQQERAAHTKKGIPTRIRRGTLPDLIAVMESEPKLRRSKSLLYAYANR